MTRLCRECYNELDDESEMSDRCLVCDEETGSWPWDIWDDFEEMDLDVLDAMQLLDGETDDEEEE